MAGSFPLSSRPICLIAAADAMTLAPVAVEPVKAILSTPGVGGERSA